MIVGEAEFGIQISQLKLSIAETKGITRSKLAKTLLDALVPREVQEIGIWSSRWEVTTRPKASCSNKM